MALSVGRYGLVYAMSDPRLGYLFLALAIALPGALSARSCLEGRSRSADTSIVTADLLSVKVLRTRGFVPAISPFQGESEE